MPSVFASAGICSALLCCVRNAAIARETHQAPERLLNTKPAGAAAAIPQRTALLSSRWTLRQMNAAARLFSEPHTGRSFWQHLP